ncbi:MAG: hypothetical protein JWM21_2861 [Acidobacteria bacterium]|nr:hypothetical protein [Acidobacteriota bacterium]
MPPCKAISSRGFKIIFAYCFWLVILSSNARAQQPFYTDNADVTDKKKIHFQLGNEFDILQRVAYPSLRQNTTVFELDYGLLNGVEIGVDAPLIAISNSHVVTPMTVVGFGDLDFHVKYNFHKEREGSRLPALTVTVNVELPTGNAQKQLGSGVVDFFVNGIAQKSLTKKTTLRMNGGILFAGNTTTGDIGIKARGRVFVGGTSLVKQFTPKLDLGVEVTGAVTNSLKLSRGQLQSLVGGNYSLRKNMTFDFGVVVGRFAASPRVGAQLGISLDF